MKTSFSKLGLERNYLYEIVATTYSIEGQNKIPNGSCMGIRFIDNAFLTITPHHTTRTYENLKKIPYITVNFIDNVYIYALMALSSPKYSENDKNDMNALYDYYKLSRENVDIPYVKTAHVIILCKVNDEKVFHKEDQLGSSSLSEFKLKILEYVKFKDTISLFNRSDYLTMEAIILSTKLKVAKQNKEQSYASILEAKIEDIFNQVKRFGRNQRALKAIEFISEFKENLSI